MVIYAIPLVCITVPFSTLLCFLSLIFTPSDIPAIPQTHQTVPFVLKLLILPYSLEDINYVTLIAVFSASNDYKEGMFVFNRIRRYPWSSFHSVFNIPFKGADTCHLNQQIENYYFKLLFKNY